MRKGTVYICTRLFNYSDKIQAEYFEEVLRREVQCNTFMPFRDTDENNLVGHNRTRIIYEEDIARLNSDEVILLAVLYDGICKDEGISFEIGYAFGKSIPIYIVNTDFIWYMVEEKEYHFDPIIEYMTAGFVHFYKIDENPSFKDALLEGQEKAFKIAAKEIKYMLETIENNENIKSKLEENIDVFIDFGGCRYEYQREIAFWLKKQLEQYNVNVEISDRYNKMVSEDIVQCGYKDVERLLNSRYFICLGDEVELNAGTAALLGLAKCKNKKVILYESSNMEICGENGHHMKKNLMIDFSVDKIIKSKKEIVRYILEDIDV